MTLQKDKSKFIMKYSLVPYFEEVLLQGGFCFTIPFIKKNFIKVKWKFSSGIGMIIEKMWKYVILRLSLNVMKKKMLQWTVSSFGNWNLWPPYDSCALMSFLEGVYIHCANISSAHAQKVSIKVFSYTVSFWNKSKYHRE